MEETRRILPEAQPGPQTAYFQSEADIVIYGGSAGGGKTWALLVDAAQYSGIRDYRAIIFRRTSPQITNPGGLWDAAKNVFRSLGATMISGFTEARFPSGAVIAFRHLQLEDDKENHMGAEYAVLCFDELPHFTEGQFFYLISRNRSTCGIRPKVRATCNPSPGWVKTLIAQWVDPKHPNPAKSGEIRYFIRVDGKITWVDKSHRLEAHELGDVTGLDSEAVEEMRRPKSITFIRSSVYDNKILLSRNPHYLTNLKSLPLVEQKRLLEGDWNVFEGAFFSEFSPFLHTCPPATDENGRPKHLPTGNHATPWNFYGGNDWGYDKPWAFVLRAVDPSGTRHTIHSVQKAGLTNEEQADSICSILLRWGIPKDDCPICCDKAMWAERTHNGVKVEADIVAYKKAGLRVVKSSGTRRIHGWNQIRSWLHKGGSDTDPMKPAWIIWEGFNEDLIKRFPEMQFLEGSEDMDEDTHSGEHADLFNALRYSEEIDPGVPEGRKPAKGGSQKHLPPALRTDGVNSRKE